MTSTRKRVTAALAVGAGLLIAAPAEAAAQIPDTRDVVNLIPQLDVPPPPPLQLPPNSIPPVFPPPGLGTVLGLLSPPR